MTTLKEAATSLKFWLGVGTVVVVSLTALGATIDRPVWYSELKAIETRTVAAAERAAENSKKLLEIDAARVQEKIWALEDRQRVAPLSQDAMARLRALREQYRRLLEQLKSKG